jgi:hypothetical protein
MAHEPLEAAPIASRADHRVSGYLASSDQQGAVVEKPLDLATILARPDLSALMNPSSTAGLTPARRNRGMKPVAGLGTPSGDRLPYTCRWISLSTKLADRAGNCSAIYAIGPSGKPSQSRGKTFGGVRIDTVTYAPARTSSPAIAMPLFPAPTTRTRRPANRARSLRSEVCKT